MNNVMTTIPGQSSSDIQTLGCFTILNLACLDNAKVIVQDLVYHYKYHWKEHVLSCALCTLHRVLGSTDGASGDMQDCVD